MKYLFCIASFILYIDCCEDLLLTDSSRNKLLHIGQDFSICKEYDLTFGGLTVFDAGMIGNNITLYWINNEPIVKWSSLNKFGKFHPTQKIEIEKNMISTFEMSSNLTKLFISTEDGIYEYNIKKNMLSDVLKNKFITGLTILKDEKMFYSECKSNKGFIKTYDIVKHVEIDQVATEFCPKGVAYDAENQILFTYFDHGIYERNIKDKTLELRYIDPNVNISSIAIGVKYLFAIGYDEGLKINDVYKIAKVPEPIELSFPIDYSVLPHVTNIKDNVIVFDVGGNQIMKLNRLNKIEKKWNIDINVKNIISFRSSSSKLIWINHENNGIVFTVDLKEDQLQTSELIFRNLNGEHLVDVEIDELENIAYLATNNKIYEGTISDLTTKEMADIDGTVESIKLISEEKILFVSGCKLDQGYIIKLDYNRIDLRQTSIQINACLHRFDVDKEKNIFGATLDKIYLIQKDLSNIIKVCNAKHVTSLTLHRAYIYFISSDYKLSRIKTELASKSDDLLTYQTEPAALAFIKKIPHINETKIRVPNSSSSQVKTSSLFFILISTWLKSVLKSSKINC